MSDGDEFLFFVCLVAVVVWGFIVFLRGFLLFRKRRLIENIPTSKIRSLAMGLVKIQGDVASGDGGLLRGPFFLKECVYYMYEIQRFNEYKYGRLMDQELPKWKTLKTESESVKFRLQDETGSVLIDPAEAEINTTKGLERNIDRENLPSAAVDEFLAFHNIPCEDPEGYRYRIRYREYFIELGDKLYILGTAGKKPSRIGGSIESSTENIMIYQGGKNRPYIISDNKEEDFVKNLGTAYRIKIIGGALISILSLIILLYFTYYIYS
jgi:hypothetical protein